MLDFDLGNLGQENPWKFASSSDVQFDWTYDRGDGAMLNLYDKGKRHQWNSSDRIDWRPELDEENPGLLDDSSIPIFGTAIWDRLSRQERATVRRHHQAYTISQFLHGEQGALIASARLVQSVPDAKAKFFAATQAMDEARHVEVYARLLREKYRIDYPINLGLAGLLEDGLTERRWDFTYLTMQVLIEGMALAAFQRLRDHACHPLIATVNAYVMQDEARHVAFGREALKGVYSQLSSKERDEREEFLIEGCHRLLDRLNESVIWERLGLPAKACTAATAESSMMSGFRAQLFSRIVPTIRDIGLLGPRMIVEFEKMGVLDYARDDLSSMLQNDEQVANDFDTASRRRLADIVKVMARVPRSSNE